MLRLFLAFLFSDSQPASQGDEIILSKWRFVGTGNGKRIGGASAIKYDPLYKVHYIHFPDFPFSFSSVLWTMLKKKTG